MTDFLIFFWFIVFIKKCLFWIYLWQLKEYHTGRFIDHFRTAKGKRLFWNKLLFLKVLLILMVSILAVKIDRLLSWFAIDQYQWISRLLFTYLICFPYIVLVCYFSESIKAFKDIFRRKLKKPVLTPKTAILVFANFLVAVTFLFYNFSIIPFLTTFFAFPQITISLDSSFWLLIFDILTPLIVSVIVLCFQPLTVFIRNQLIIKKAIRKREKFKNLLVIGITGSYGKTSTKEFLAQILSEKFRVLKTKEHQNSEVGISQCILNDLKSEHEIFICEMGAYNRGGIKLLCEIVKPKIGILTGINEQHMATFGSQENIIDAKFELIESLPENGLAILNESDPKVKSEKSKVKSYSSKLKVIKCSASEQIQDLEVRKESLSFRTGEGEFNLNLVGRQNVENLLMAICCAKELEMSLEEIAQACEKIKPLEKTMELKRGVGGVAIIDDSYSANPKGVFAALDYLKLYSGQKIIIMPCLIELGKASKRVHKKIGEKIGQVCDLAVITTRDRFKEIKEGAMSAGIEQKNILFLGNPKQIFEKIKPYLKSDNIILLESRVPKKLISWLIKD